MTKDEARSSVMCAISMALKDPILQQGFEIICKENEELKRDKEDLIFVRDQKAKCMCEDKERLTQAKEIIRRLMDIINHDLKCFDTMAGVDVKQKAEQFLKELKDE